MLQYNYNYTTGEPHRTNGTVVSFVEDDTAIYFFLEDGRDTIQRDIYSGKFYEKEELEIIRRYFKPNSVFLDVGANIGNHSIYVGKFLQPSKIIPVEPFPKAATLLDINVRLNSLIDKVDQSFLGFGFSDTQHTAAAHIVPGNLGGTSFAALDEKCSDHQQSFQMVAGDDALGMARIDFIKIDVERMELQTLSGLERVIEVNRPSIFIEVDNINREAFRAWCDHNRYAIVEEFSRYGSNCNHMIIPQ